ncbi:hypothetical protein SOVF_148540 [Spinacia oleracea]|nr:hypothetical protein SOVF_148540 [Spinacia oleracea]
MRKYLKDRVLRALSTVEDTPMQQCPPSSSKPVQLYADSQAFDSSVQVDKVLSDKGREQI